MKEKWNRIWVEYDDDWEPPFRVIAERSDYVMKAEIALVGGRPVVVGISASRRGHGRPLSLRETGRLPFTTFLESARRMVGVVVVHQQGGRATLADLNDAARPRPPRGAPPRGDRGIAWWKKFADAYRALEASGVASPNAELARRMGEDVGKVRVWVYRAREKGVLERPPKARSV